MFERPPVDGWTANDLEAFPDDKVRREVLDGVVLVRPAPTSTHQVAAARLAVALDDTCPADKVAILGVDVLFGERRSFTPDVLVVTAAAAKRTSRPFVPHEVVLATEIEAPTSVGMDRITKPAIYAGAGIPFYWRVETDGGITVHTYRIDPVNEVYLPAGTFGDVIRVAEPWPIEIPISRLTPRWG